VLIVEDSDDDTMLMVEQLRKGGLSVEHRRVETEEELRNALSSARWDVVIVDYVLPRFNGLEALRLVKRHDPDIPLILVSGKIEEGTAIEAMKAGADDYLFKDRLARLAASVRRELEAARVRREKRRKEEELARMREKLDLCGSVTRHDVLNQLSILRGWLEIVRESPTDKDVPQYLAKMKEAIDAIEKQMQFSRDYQHLGVKAPEWIDVRQALASSTSRLDLGDVKLVVELGDLEVYADQMLEKVFLNLLSNSLRHGKKLTQIKLHYKEGPQGLVLFCEDDGVGIPAAEKKSIFERGSGVRRSYGLHLASRILAITGLTIQETGEPGKGARFEILVPRGCYRFKGSHG